MILGLSEILVAAHRVPACLLAAVGACSTWAPSVQWVGQSLSAVARKAWPGCLTTKALEAEQQNSYESKTNRITVYVSTVIECQWNNSEKEKIP